MKDIGENIRKIRTEKGLTQDELAELLCVTRQTVSSWETGRSEPSIDMISELSKAFGVGLDELIPLSAYEKGKTRYKVLAALCGILSIAGIALKLWLEPSLLRWQRQHFDSKPLFLFRYVAVPIIAAAFAVFLLSLLSLNHDISVSGKKKGILLLAGVLLLFPWLVTAVPIMLFDLNGLKLLIPWTFLLRDTRFIYSLILPFLAGLFLFLGTNSK